MEQILKKDSKKKDGSVGSGTQRTNLITKMNEFQIEEYFKALYITLTKWLFYQRFTLL